MRRIFMHNPNKYGAFILHINGSLITHDNWYNGIYPAKEAVGIAVITENCEFMISLDEQTDSIMLGRYKSLWPIPELRDIEDAKKDFDGKGNTDKITSYSGLSEGYSAGYCANYTFINGQRGYLGSVGEWQAVNSLWNPINSCLNVARGAKLAWWKDPQRGGGYWTSTQYNNNHQWAARYSDGFVSEQSDFQQRVRPFGKLK